MSSFSEIQIHSLKNLYQPFGVAVDVLRLDLVHPVVSGNKWFKLKEYIAEAREQKKRIILTFGGAFSNHIVACAAACNEGGFNSIGVIRGEKPETLSDTLQDAMRYGMQLHFITREAYKHKLLPQNIYHTFDENKIYIIGEGGYGIKGCQGASSILTSIQPDYTHIIAAAGTGTTVAGLVAAALPHQKIIGVSVLKNHYSLEKEINALLPPQNQHQFTLIHDLNFGGYAKYTPELISFMNLWYKQTAIPSDFVYTGKLFYAVHHLIEKDFFPIGSKILLVHSGGLQGNRSLPKGTLMF
jgi:1-aminocyclopropane-1-carboxylate deaminase